MRAAYYDENFNSIKNVGKNFYDTSKFNSSALNEMKSYAIKLSEDFPNFIRVVYLSELTFDSHSGVPVFRDIKYFTDGVKTWKRVDY